MTFKELLEKYNLKFKDISKMFLVPYRTTENWWRGKSQCPEYWLRLMDWALSKGFRGF